MSFDVKQYTVVVMEYYSLEMLGWCDENIAGYGRLVQPSFYFDTGYSWYAEWRRNGIGMTFHFARPEDATMFALRWS